MAETPRIEQIIEKAVSAVLENQLPQLRQQLVRQVLAEVQPHLGESGNPSGGSAAELLKAVSSIQAGSTQKEILRALLDASARHSGRTALFVIKAGAANGWQGRGFDNNEDIKDFSLDVNSSGPAQVLQNRSAATLVVSEMDAKFISRFGAPAQDQLCLLPLHLKDKVAALVYADAGMDAGGALDTAALQLLVAATSGWLEVASLRKQAAKEGAAEASSEPAPVPVQTASSYSDPFAGHAPKHAAAPPPEVAQPAAAVASSEPVIAAAATAAAAAPATDAFAQMSVEDAEVHRKAQRFARLLMDEVKLYNQAKVAEGRKNKDLYDRLREDIEKSRSTYMKRYGNTVAASADHFSTEVIRSLAEDDASLLGPNFRR